MDADRAAEAAENRGTWCRWCDGEVRRDGRIAVHADTGLVDCADGCHVAAATLVPPRMRAEARLIAAEFGHRWKISTDPGFFCAVRAGVTGARSPVEASTAGEFRELLRARERTDALRAQDLDRAEREAARMAAEGDS